MNTEIEAKKLAETTLCESSFKCLHNYPEGCCEVEKCNYGLMILLKCAGSKYCNYKKFIGFSSFKCTCPTRIAIFQKYSE